MAVSLSKSTRPYILKGKQENRDSTRKYVHYPKNSYVFADIYNVSIVKRLSSAKDYVVRDKNF